MPPKIGFRALREIFSPCGFEGGPRLIEARRSVFDMPAAMRQRVEAALPAPLVNIDRHAGAERDRTDLHIAIVDVPAIRTFGGAAAGEGGHSLLKRGPGG
jgi:hypothetical protein